jgi:hypothetical protein
MRPGGYGTIVLGERIGKGAAIMRALWSLDIPPGAIAAAILPCSKMRLI